MKEFNRDPVASRKVKITSQSNQVKQELIVIKIIIINL